MQPSAVDLLAFERRWWRTAGAKAEAIRGELGLSETAYYQRLNRLLDDPEAFLADPADGEPPSSAPRPAARCPQERVMAHIRKLPSGKWQATVRHPSGRRISHTDLLRRAVVDWAKDLEARYARGDTFDPRAGNVHLDEWWARWHVTRIVADATAAKNASFYRTHVEPRWGSWPLATIRRMDVAAWVKEMQRAGVGEWTAAGALHLLAAMLEAAVDEGLLAANPARGVNAPAPPRRAPRWFTRDQAAALLAALDEPWRLLVDVDLHLGLRWGELAGLHGSEVDWLRGRLWVVRVLTRTGLRDYPKSRRSYREVPIPPRLLEQLSRHMGGRDRDGLVFTAPAGGPLDESRFRRRVWYPALARAGAPPWPPHTMRHTAASWLVQAGVPLYDVQRLLGHEDSRTTERYAHLAPDAHQRVLGAWAGDASLPHGTTKSPVLGKGAGL